MSTRNTDYKYTQLLGENTFAESREDGSFIWENYYDEEQIIVSIAPGKTLDWFTEQFGRELKVIRTMPNTPAMVKEGDDGYVHWK